MDLDPGTTFVFIFRRVIFVVKEYYFGFPNVFFLLVSQACRVDGAVAVSRTNSFFQYQFHFFRYIPRTEL